MIKKLISAFAVLALGATLLIAQDKEEPAGLPDPGKTPSPKGAKVYFIGLKDGATVKKKFRIRFGLKGMGIAPAGYYNAEKPTGHHHLFINHKGDILPAVAFPMDDNHKHFGGGQTEAIIELPPGKHVLQLVLGDHIHTLHNPPVVSEKITITVEE